MNLEETISKIIQNPLFLKLNNVVENNGYHDHEAVYDHLVKTKDIALREIKADFITNPEAKVKFLEFVKSDFYGLKKADIMILIALLHDIGKILSIKKGETLHSILVTTNGGITFCPGHEYEGSKIVSEFTKDLNLLPEVTSYISKVIQNHDTYNQLYLEGRNAWPQDILLKDIKSRADGVYIEAMFNIYCDCFTAQPFQKAKGMIIEIFNNPNLYTSEEYVIT